MAVVEEVLGCAYEDCPGVSRGGGVSEGVREWVRGGVREGVWECGSENEEECEEEGECGSERVGEGWHGWYSVVVGE